MPESQNYRMERKLERRIPEMDLKKNIHFVPIIHSLPAHCPVA